MVSMLSFFIFTANYYFDLGVLKKSHSEVEPPVSHPKQVEMPTVQKSQLEGVKEASSTQHWLWVTSEPEGAAVRYQGKDLGAAPLKISIEPSLFPFNLEAYLENYGIIKAECFAKPTDKKTEHPCVLKFQKKPSNKAPNLEPNKSKNRSKASEKVRPKLQLIE